ncbi:hypothetical protein HMPREF1624_06719 [Sporothrix schenckii ATCC 58251]|uniref:chitinase n=1 Tax=Sporothrix schenckii (strain ATCC 58251 / de Perez 2211183) TaxID=1391915 RepID=U7PPV9_SPOS1|nr:hypothetical protein HMPREF1624_06719 [Sporothrix schenckii ATCC 58251]
MLPTWVTSAAAAGFILLSSGIIGGADASHFGLRMPASPKYKSRSGNCPTSCALVGPDPANWPVYKNTAQLDKCTETIFYHMSLSDNVDDSTLSHRIYACASYGSFKAAGAASSTMRVKQTLDNATFTVGHWDENAPAGVDLRDLSKQVRRFLTSGFMATPGNSSSSYATAGNQPQVLFAQTSGGTVGLYVGKAIQSLSSVTGALKSLEQSLTATNETTGTVALELCGTHYDADHIIGFMATSNTSFAPVQQVLQSWSKASCIDYNSTQTFTSPVSFTTPLVIPTTNSTGASNSTVVARDLHGHSHHHSRSPAHAHAFLTPRADCTTVQVVYGDTCGTLATKCGISAADFTKYNPSSTLCSKLAPGQHVCCSSGTLPSFAPKPNSDGSCYSYTVVANDNCADLAAAYDLTNDLIESFNNETWGWQGCGNVLLGAVICLSTGSPPMPAAIANAECGPQKPGTVVGPGGTYNLSGLNPCPLNACCDIWGECGITEEFCVDTSLGPPGTAKKGTNGCISNCGTDVISGDAPISPINLAYFEGYGMDRPCLYQDISQLSTAYTHVHFAFATLDPSTYAVSVGSAASTYEFDRFTRLGKSFHRVLTVGGWSFSTDPSTYSIFRNGVTAGNRVAMATAIANFVKDNELDGIDIDWEYPGAPDIPGIPAASTDDGANYLAFLVVLKNLLPGKTVSIAAPSSYWYLKGFPIKKISEVVDYIVYMTYDLHGQWDSGNSYSQEGCPTGNCLRSHVNLTETMTSLAMITKAGVPSGKVVVGVTSYGRSFGMTDPGCYTPECTFGGGAAGSTATQGPCTGTGGYLADAEITDIMEGTNSTSNEKRRRRRDSTSLSSRVNQYYYDKDSDSQILVFDDNQWVSFMTADIRASRTAKYKSLGLGGTTNWASDLQTFNEVPGNVPNWDAFILAVKTGLDPMSDLSVDPSQISGNWTKLSCTDPAVVDVRHMTSEERWDRLDCTDAWNDVINVWKTTDINNGMYLSASISASINGPESSNCGSLAATSNCDRILLCKDVENTQGSGPAAYEIWNSLVYVHEIYETFHSTIIQAAALSLNPSLDQFENTFAPVTPPDTEWLDLLLAFVNLAGTVVVSSFFNSILKALPFFKANGVQYDNYKDAAKALVSFGVSVTGTYVSGSEGSWTPASQTSFSNYLGQVVDIWANSTEQQLSNIFSGQPDTLPILAGLINKGQMIEGATGSDSAAGTTPNVGISNITTTSVEASIERSFYAFAIPAVWRASGTGAFILDTGADCSDLNVASQYVPLNIQKQAMGCIDNHLYFLVFPDGKSPDSCNAEDCWNDGFSLPAGVDVLDGSSWGGVTVTDIVNGSVRTYIANGHKNGGYSADPTDTSTMNSLYDQDITTPGYISLPVCSGQTAFRTWQLHSDRSLDNWPCYLTPQRGSCESSSFIDQTSDASPSVDDCMHLVNNIIGTDGSWWKDTAFLQQHQVAGYGSCNFGIQATDLHGNAQYQIQAQDIVDIVTESVKLFGGSGKVGAKGYMDCDGNVNSQDVLWGLY